MNYIQYYDNCQLCPRKCGINRNLNRTGFCGETSTPRIGRAALHHWEEPCISGQRGSGTVFFSGCSLHCCYCQNYKLSQGRVGTDADSEQLSKIFLDLAFQGAHNINLVTAEHFAPHIKNAVLKARATGLQIPIILNSSGYVSLKTLEILKDVIDIYLVDFKYMDSDLAKKYSLAHDYPDVAKAALCQMVRLTGKPLFDSEGMLKKGVVVRHLCLPSHTEDSKNVIKYVFESYGKKVILSIMSQYTPLKNGASFKELQRKLTQREYDEVIDFCLETGISDAYIQDGESASESFIPEFG